MHRIQTAAHLALLDVLTGEGVLVLPDPAHDVTEPGIVTLHAADWAAMIRTLDGLGWQPSEDEDGGTLLAGYASDGREVIGLYGREPVHAEPSIEACACAVSAMLATL